MQKCCHLFAVLLLAGSLSGCAVGGSGADRAALSELAERSPVYAASAPSFFPQQALHCGPAALAMTMVDLGYSVTPAQTTPLAFLPGREGSLQLEMVAATRNLEALPVPVAPQLDALLTEVANGHSPIVLMNLGLSWIPRWHYATVTGYNLVNNTIALRSGMNPNQQMTLYTFRHVWGRAKNWAFSVHKPGDLPATATQQTLEKAALAFERVNGGVLALAAWQSIANHWPDSKLAHVGLGNQAYMLGNLLRAKKAFQKAATIDPRSPAAWNNLAIVLTDLGELDAAGTALTQAESVTSRQTQQIIDTRKMLQRVIKPES